MPKRGQHMSPETKKKIAESQKKRNRQAAAAGPGGPDPLKKEPIVEQVAGIEAEVTPPANEKKTLLERLQSKVAPKGSASSGDNKSGGDTAGLADMLPIVAAFLAWQASKMFGDDYKACSPNPQEIETCIKPVTRIIARRLEVTIEMTPDMKDLQAIMTGIIMYGFRAGMLANQIKTEKEQEKAVSYAENYLRETAGGNTAGHATGQRDTRGKIDQSPGGGTTRNYRGFFGGTESGESSTRQYQDNSLGSVDDASYARSVIAQAFEQDKQYRTEHGLL